MIFRPSRSFRKEAMMSTKELDGNSSFLTFFGVVSIVPVTIQLPDLDSQTEFNLARWEQVLADTTLAALSYRIETDQHGHILMSPPSSSPSWSAPNPDRHPGHHCLYE
jgi:hypothetical protein